MEYLKELLPASVVQDVLRFGAIFSLAAFIHAKQMRIEIKKQFTVLIDAFNNWAATYEKRIELVEDEVRQLKLLSRSINNKEE